MTVLKKKKAMCEASLDEEFDRKGSHANSPLQNLNTWMPGPGHHMLISEI